MSHCAMSYHIGDFIYMLVINKSINLNTLIIKINTNIIIIPTFKNHYTYYTILYL